MNSDSDNLQDYKAVDESLNAVPDDISSRMAEISGKDAILHQFAKKCKIQNNEIKQRTATLNMYANSLLNIDSNIKKEKEIFAQEMNQQFTELNENENELNEEITLHETQHQENEKRIQLIEKMKEQTLAKCKENAKEIQELTQKLEEINAKPPVKPVFEIPDDHIDDFKKQIEEEKIRVKPLDEKIQKQNQRIAKITNANNSFSNKIDEKRQKAQEIQTKIQQSKNDQEEKLAEIKRKIQKAKKNISTLTQLHSDLESHSFSSRNRMTRIQNKINSISSKEDKYQQALSIMREKDNEISSQVKQLQDQKKQYKDAYQQRIDFYKNLDISNKRALNRTNEIASELQTTRELQKKVDVEQFETETVIDKCKEQETDIIEEMEKLDQEISVAKQQEDESLLQFNQTQSELTDVENKENEYEETRKKLKELKINLQNKITKAHNDEKDLIQAFQRLKLSRNSTQDPEINEIQNSINVYIDGYKSKLQFVTDANRLLNEKIKTEELRNTFCNSEYRRASSQYNTLTTQIIQSPKVKTVTFATNGDVRTEITQLETTIQEKKSKIAVMERSISSKSRSQIDDLQETNYHEHMETRTNVATKFIQQAEALVKEAEKSIKLIKDGGSTTEILDNINFWDSMISKMVNDAEDIEMEAELN